MSHSPLFQSTVTDRLLEHMTSLALYEFECDRSVSNLNEFCYHRHFKRSSKAKPHRYRVNGHTQQLDPKEGVEFGFDCTAQCKETFGEDWSAQAYRQFAQTEQGWLSQSLRYEDMPDIEPRKVSCPYDHC